MKKSSSILKNVHICSSCHKLNPDPAYKMCPACREKRRKEASASKRRIRQNSEMACQSIRHCHDCGAETTNYRCSACLAKFRARHGVPINNDDDYLAAY